MFKKKKKKTGAPSPIQLPLSEPVKGRLFYFHFQVPMRLWQSLQNIL